MLVSLIPTQRDHRPKRAEHAQNEQASSTTREPLPAARRFGTRFLDLPVVRNRVPRRCRPALYFETWYNVGSGAVVSLFLLSPVVLTTILDGSDRHLALLSAMFGGSSLLSPLVSYLGRKIPMRSLVVFPNLLVAGLLFATAFSGGRATFFTMIVGAVFVIRVFPRVAEMNMYRLLYPATHRGAAVGWVKAIAAISGSGVLLTGYGWFSFQPNLYWGIYAFVGCLLIASVYSYSRIPLQRNNVFARSDAMTPHRAFWEGLKIFAKDRAFVMYQFGFSLAGFANHMALVFVAAVLRENVIADQSKENLVPQALHHFLFNTMDLGQQTIVVLIVGFIIAVAPSLLMMTSMPFWGRLLDRINPMIGRAIFNTIQCVAYACYAYGGLTLQIWPFTVGAVLHGIGNGGSTINWLTGSLYFASPERVSLYNAIHVGLTGLRGLIAPLCGWYLLSSAGFDLGAGVFAIAAVLSFIGAAMMLYQGLTDTGPHESAG
jgi:hypothetical protein